MKRVIVYIHGKGGNAKETEHYKPLFPEDEVIGFDYRAQSPWEALDEFHPFFEKLQNEYDAIVLIANSIGAFFAICALGKMRIEKAYFISPIVNMEKLITDMMLWSGVSENELMEKGEIKTSFGETLSWEYLTWVRKHPVSWSIPTKILYGSNDNMQSIAAIQEFSQSCGAELTVMENGEHWFHTAEQMAFLDDWIIKLKNISCTDVQEIFRDCQKTLSSAEKKIE